MNKKYYTILILAIQIAAGFIYGYVREENADRIREPRLVGDTEDYFHNAGLPVFSLEFWTDARPPITALLWKFAGSDPEAIFKLQLFFSIASWIALAFAAAHALKTGWLKPLIFIVTLAFSVSRDVFMWDPFMGSESISLSFMALFLAAAVWLFAGWATYKAALLVILAFFFAFTRDTNAYLLLMIAGLISVVFAFSIHRHKAWMVGGAFLLIFLASSQLSLLGLRPYRAILMNTSLRIFPSEIYTEYFRQHGMPVDDRLVRMARNMQPGETFAVNMALMFDQDQEEFRQWALGPGPREYVRFLWFYKAETFQNVFLETPEESFYPDVYYYTATGYRPIIANDRIAEFLYPTRFGLIFFFAVNLIAAFVAAFAWRDGRALWLIPVLMILLSYPQAVLVWAADVNDVARHSIPHNVLMRLGFWFLIFFVADFLLTDLPARMPFLQRLRNPTA